MKWLYPALVAAAGICAQPAPGVSEQQAMLARITQNALHSQDELPDFICTQRTKRSEDASGKGKRFKQRDILEVEFTFIGRHPKWNLLKLDGKPTRLSYNRIRSGFLSDAILEFFSLPDSIFGDEIQPHFVWNRWETLNGRRTGVFSFRVPSSASQLALTNEWQANVVGFHGLMYADASSETVTRIEVQLDLPRDGPARECSIDVDYGMVTIADRQFLLPVKAVARMRTLLGMAKNETEVVRYQKYAADSSVTFGAPDR
jgi:hypothetical protein